MTRDQQILAAAERLFSERSFDGVSVDEIGRAAGVSGSAIYSYFSGKDEILSALLGQALDSLLRHMGEPDPDPRAELERIVRAFLDLASAQEGLAAIWVREQRSLADSYRREHERRHRYITERWSNCLVRCFPGRSEDDLTTVARALQLLLMSEALRPPHGRRAPDAEALLVDMALASLSVLERPRPDAGHQESTNATSSVSNASAASSIG